MDNSAYNVTEKETIQQEKEQESQFDFREFIDKILPWWPWILVSVIVFGCLAVLYVKTTQQVFRVQAKILVKDNDQYSSRYRSGTLASLSAMGVISNSEGIDNEIEIINSRYITRDAVATLGLYVDYTIKDGLRKKNIYGHQPINVDLDQEALENMDETMYPIELIMEKPDEKGTIHITGFTYQGDEEEGEEVEKVPFETTITSLPASFKTQAGILTFTESNVKKPIKNKKIEITIFPLAYMATKYMVAMSIEKSSMSSSSMLITVDDNSAERASDYIKQLVVSYNRMGNADKNEVALRTEEFINERIEKINNELGSTESSLEEFKRSQNLTELKLDATQSLTQISQYTTRLSEAKAQIELLDYLREYVDDPKNKYQIIPSNVGLTDNSSTSLINEYNKSVLERNRVLLSASEISPQVQLLTSTLNDLESSIKTALKQARRAADIELQNIQQQYALYSGKISSTPKQERVLTEIGRQQEVMSGLYLLLLEKREENSISLASTADKGKLIDDPIFAGKVKPKGFIILFVALIIGFALPIAVIYLIDFLHFKITNAQEVGKLTKLPIVAEIPLAKEKEKNEFVVKKNRNDIMDEVFRSLRTNLVFMLSGTKKVVMLTSCQSGEGKTFVGLNLALSFANLGKRVIFVGLDIRKPRLAQLFGIKDRNTGISNLLRLQDITESDVEKNIFSNINDSNLDILPAGTIPPNPAELIAGNGLESVFKILRQKYDYIVIDTPPVGLVSDTLNIGRVSDICIAVCRCDYTPKSAFNLINFLNENKRLPEMCVVVNAIDKSKRKNRGYYGSKRYAYGYTYGDHTYGATDNES